MPSGTLGPPISRQFTDDNARPLAYGKLYAYKAGTSADEPIYQDALLTIEHPQPAPLDDAGRLTFFLSATSYRFLLFDQNDVQISDEDGISAYQGVSGSAGLDEDAIAGEALTANEAVYQSDGGDGGIAGRWYRTNAADPLKSVVPQLVRFAIANIALGANGLVRRAGLLDGFVGLAVGAPYYLDTIVGGITSIAPSNGRRVGVAKAAATLVVDPIELDPKVAAGLIYFPFGGSALQEVVANAYPIGASYDKLAPNSSVWNLDAKNAGGVWKLEALLASDGGATVSLKLVNLTDAPDGSVVEITSVSGTGQRVQSAAIVFPAVGALKDYGVKLKTSDATKRVWAWGIRLVRTQ